VVNARLHRWLGCGGLVLAAAGLAELIVFITACDYFRANYAVVATLGAMWWANRMFQWSHDYQQGWV